MWLYLNKVRLLKNSNMKQFFLIYTVFSPFLLFSQECKILGKTEPFSYVIIQGSSVSTISNELVFELNSYTWCI